MPVFIQLLVAVPLEMSPVSDYGTVEHAQKCGGSLKNIGVSHRGCHYPVSVGYLPYPDGKI
jgi:hypothetical protein